MKKEIKSNEEFAIEAKLNTVEIENNISIEIMYNSVEIDGEGMIYE